LNGSAKAHDKPNRLLDSIEIETTPCHHPSLARPTVLVLIFPIKSTGQRAKCATQEGFFSHFAGSPARLFAFPQALLLNKPFAEAKPQY
jgi:hypothetical protein